MQYLFAVQWVWLVSHKVGTGPGVPDDAFSPDDLGVHDGDGLELPGVPTRDCQFRLTSAGERV